MPRYISTKYHHYHPSFILRKCVEDFLLQMLQVGFALLVYIKLPSNKFQCLLHAPQFNILFVYLSVLSSFQARLTLRITTGIDAKVGEFPNSLIYHLCLHGGLHPSKQCFIHCTSAFIKPHLDALEADKKICAKDAVLLTFNNKTIQFRIQRVWYVVTRNDLLKRRSHLLVRGTIIGFPGD